MPVLAATNLKYSIGTRVLLDGASLSLEAGERIGLVGRNGQGKTTLIRVLMDRVKPDAGSVNVQRGARIGYLSQDPELDYSRTLRDEAAAGFLELTRAHDELNAVYDEMGKPENAAPEMLDRLMHRQSELEKRIDMLGGYAVDHKVEAVLHGLGFTDAQFAVPVSGLSGGQKGRLGLAKLLLEGPDVLLLDEPTNHLDIAGREWLEEFLVREFRGAVLLVSHDRYLLDRVVTRIEEVERGRLIEYPGNYTAFREIRAQRLLTQHRAYENQQSQWSKEEEFIRRFKAGQRAKEAQGRLSKLERAKRDDAVERPSEMGAMRMVIPEAPRSGDIVLTVRGASKSYENEGGGRKTLYEGLDVTISRGERWAIIGPNGAGKTTLVKCILGEVALDAGTTRLGANVVIGYYSQLPRDEGAGQTVWEYLQGAIRRENPDLERVSEQRARDLAGSFLFSGEDQQKPMEALSGGERSRARLAALLASAKNLLVLDEPTNHLDIPSAERLEEVLGAGGEDGDAAYGGTLILISHDRALIDATCEHLIVMDGAGGATVFHGTYSEWHRKQVEDARRATQQAEEAAKRKQREKPKPAPQTAWSKPQPKDQPRPKKGGGLSWMPADRLEKEMESAAKRLREADDELAKEETYRDAARFKALMAERDEIAAEVNKLEEEWLRRMED